MTASPEGRLSPCESPTAQAALGSDCARWPAQARGWFAWGVCAIAAGCGPSEPPPAAPSAPSASPTSFFRDAADAAGLTFQHEAGPVGEFFFPQIMGGGAALFDFDGDGDLDVYLVHCAVRPGSAASEDAPRHQLFRQDPGLKFVDVSRGSGLDVATCGMGVCTGDANNDGLPDLLLTNYGPDRLFLNLGGGRFRDVTAEAGLANERWGMSACWLDFDRDGWLDLFVTNYVDYDPAVFCKEPNGRQDYCNPKLFPGTPDRLFRNVTGERPSNGAGPRLPAFVDVSLESGIAQQHGPGLGAVAADFNADGWPDIYVANDGAANFLWINQHDGTFRDEAVLRAAAHDRAGRPQASMGIALADVDSDFDFDLLLTHLFSENNALYLNDGIAFSERSTAWGLAEISRPWTGFGAAFFDLEHDGDLDLAVVNGKVRRTADGTARDTEGAFWESYAEPNQLLIQAEPRAFTAKPAAADEFSTRAEVSRALCMGDVDNDGDVDLLVANLAGPARLFLNEAERAGRWIRVRAVLPQAGGRDAYGAVVLVRLGSRARINVVSPNSSYLGTHDARLHFGVGSFEAVDAIDVTWPDGVSERFPGGPTDAEFVLQQGAGAPLP